jgi:hypothetical protein
MGQSKFPRWIQVQSLSKMRFGSRDGQMFLMRSMRLVGKGVWSQQTISGSLRTIRDIPMVGQLGHFKNRQQDRERFSLGDLDDDVMRHMGACLVFQHHESGMTP